MKISFEVKVSVHRDIQDGQDKTRYENQRKNLFWLLNSIRIYPVHPCKIKVLKSRSVLTGIFRMVRINLMLNQKKDPVLVFELIRSYPVHPCKIKVLKSKTVSTGIFRIKAKARYLPLKP